MEIAKLGCAHCTGKLGAKKSPKSPPSPDMFKVNCHEQSLQTSNRVDDDIQIECEYKYIVQIMKYDVLNVLCEFENLFKLFCYGCYFHKNNNIHEIDIYVEEICSVHKSNRANNIIKIITVISL